MRGATTPSAIEKVSSHILHYICSLEVMQSRSEQPIVHNDTFLISQLTIHIIKVIGHGDTLSSQLLTVTLHLSKFPMVCH